MEDTNNFVDTIIDADVPNVDIDNVLEVPVIEEIFTEEKQDVIVVEAPKRKKKETLNKAICKVNYNLPKKNKTSILYSNGNSSYSVFIDGIYNGTIEVEYTGDKFFVKNIKNIRSI